MKKKVITISFLMLFSTVFLFSQTLGDVNNDGSADIVDALLIAQYYVGLDPQNFDSDNADVDCSGSVDIIDALLVSQYYVGLISEFPCQSPTPIPGDFSDIFCTFRWGMNWGSGTIPDNIDMISVWVGYEEDDGMNNAVSEMLTDAQTRGVIPVYYAYFIAFKASIRDGIGDCNTDTDGHNLCNEGAQWLRDNLSYILDVYDIYAQLTVDVWGTEDPIIWLIEPDFIQYTYEEQTNPFTTQEIADIASDIIDVIKARMPNAVISLFHATWTYDTDDYWSYFDLSKVDMINTTGMADQDGYYNDGYAYGREGATYAHLHEVTGKPIFTDTSFGVTEQDNTWSNADVETLNARIADGVFAVLIEPPPDLYEEQIDSLNPYLDSPCQ